MGPRMSPIGKESDFKVGQKVTVLGGRVCRVEENVCMKLVVKSQGLGTDCQSSKPTFETWKLLTLVR